MQENGNDLSLIEALVLFSKTLSSEIFKDGEISIPGILDGIKKFSYNGTIDNKNEVHNYSLNIDYSQTAYEDSQLNNKVIEFDIFVKETVNGLNVTVNNIAKNKKHLIELIKKEIELNGKNCDLNHLDVSHVTDMSYLFNDSEFNGNIDQWNISNVKNMTAMFCRSQFNGDISQWNTSNVENMDDLFNHYKHTIDISKWDVSNVLSMRQMFCQSQFNGDISNWNVSNVKNMLYMFAESKFNNDISNWKPYNVEDIIDMFVLCNAKIPYWSNYENKEKRKIAIDNYWLSKELDKELNEKNNLAKRIKL